jgi:hypothetical protein
MTRNRATTGMTDTPPVVPCVVIWSEAEGGWVATVISCPFCGGRHRHGAGLGPHPEMGVRLPPCGDIRYRLVLQPRTGRGDRRRAE